MIAVDFQRRRRSPARRPGPAEPSPRTRPRTSGGERDKTTGTERYGPKPGTDPERAAAAAFSTVSDMEIKECYMADETSPAAMPRTPTSAGPGEFPYTRGVYPTMYRGRPWTMRQFAGFGTPRDTNERFKFLLAQRPDRALDRLRYADPHGLRRRPRARARRGRARGARRSRPSTTWRALFDGIALDEVTTSMTVNCSASIILAMYFAVAERRGHPDERSSAAPSRTTC